MLWNLDKSRPLCPQLCQLLCARIVAGEILPGQKILSVRELALAAGVNPNTVQSAFNQLEQQGILYSVPGAGWFAAEDTAAAINMQQRLVKERTAAFFAELSSLGIPAADIKELVKEWEI